jgi:hypothetical protein
VTSTLTLPAEKSFSLIAVSVNTGSGVGAGVGSAVGSGVGAWVASGVGVAIGASAGAEGAAQAANEKRIKIASNADSRRFIGRFSFINSLRTQ